VPGSFPPVVFVHFDPAQTSAEAIVLAAKAGLESDPFNTRSVAVTLEPADLVAPAALAPIVRFQATELWVRPLASDALRLNSELFSCGTCLSLVTQALSQEPGVLEARPERSAGATIVVVTYDPSVIGPEQIAQIAKQAIEADPLVGSTVTVHFLTPN